MTRGNLSPRFIEVGAEGQSGGYTLSLSFDDEWAGLLKSVVFYDKRRTKVASYDFLGADGTEVEIPSTVLGEDGRHPFIVIGSEVIGDSEETAQEIPRRITECAFVCVGDSIYPELNSTAIEELDTDAYASFLRAYFGCLKTAETLKGQYDGLSQALETASGYSETAKSYAVGDTGKRSGEATDNAKYYSNSAAANADKAKASADGAKASAEAAEEEAATVSAGLSEMSRLYTEGKEEIEAVQEAVEEAKETAEKAQAAAEAAKTEAVGSKESAANCKETAKAHAEAAANSSLSASGSAESAEKSANAAKASAATAKESETQAKGYTEKAKESADEAATSLSETNKLFSSGVAQVNEAKEKTLEARNETISAMDEAKKAAEKVGGTICYRGKTSSLPEAAEKGDVYKLESGYVCGHCEVPVQCTLDDYEDSPGIKKVVSTPNNTYELFAYLTETQGNVDNYYYYNGTRYHMPFVITLSYEGENILFYSDGIFETLLPLSEPIVCDLTSPKISEYPGLLNGFAGAIYGKGSCVVWDGETWQSFDADYANIADNSVTTNKIETGAVTSDKLAGGAVTASKLANYSVTSSKISGAIPVSKGGTGKSSWSSGGLIYASGTTALSQVTSPTAESVLCQKASGAPYWKAVSELGGGGFKKIGYTDDCDYKVSSSSGGKAAFTAAINAAADGDTIIVMPGEYGGSGTLTFKKNLNFIGIGNPSVGFAITVENGSVFDYESMTWSTLDDTYTTTWSGFVFEKAVDSKVVVGADAGAENRLYAWDCIFKDTVYLSGALHGCTLCKGATASGYGGYGVGELHLYNCNMLSGNLNGDAKTYIDGGTYRFINSSNAIGGSFNLTLWNGASLYTYGCSFSGEYGYSTSIDKNITNCTIYSDSNPFEASHCENCFLVTVTQIT